MRAGVQLAVVLVLTSALLVLTTVTAPGASAQNTFDDDRVEFGGVNGKASAVRAVGDQVWVGGEFTEALDPDHTTSYARANVAVFDFNTGEVLPLVFDTNDKVKAIESDDATTVWVAGNFTEIAGQAVTSIAAFDVFTGEIRDDFNIVVDYEINALHYTDGWLYIGGEFGQVNGLYYNKLARVDAATGVVDTNFRANPNATVRSIDSYGDRVYAAGLFDEVGKVPDNYPRLWIAGFDVDTGGPAGPDFPFTPLGPGDGVHKAGLWRVHVSEDGNHIYTADQRNFIIKWNRTTGQKVWEREAEGDIQAIATDGGSIYLGTHDGFLAKNDERLLFALDASNGVNDNSFQPLMNSFIGALELTIAQGALIVVGDFTTIKGESSPHLAVFHGPNWNGAAPLTPAYVLGDVSCDTVPDITDALLVAQFSVGLRTESATCPLSDPLTEIGPGGDVNNDGFIDVSDALMIAQCAVGLNNTFCPQ